MFTNYDGDPEVEACAHDAGLSDLLLAMLDQIEAWQGEVERLKSGG